MPSAGNGKSRSRATRAQRGGDCGGPDIQSTVYLNQPYPPSGIPINNGLPIASCGMHSEVPYAPVGFNDIRSDTTMYAGVGPFNLPVVRPIVGGCPMCAHSVGGATARKKAAAKPKPKAVAKARRRK